jgi:murein peptide amidase A
MKLGWTVLLSGIIGVSACTSKTISDIRPKESVEEKKKNEVEKQSQIAEFCAQLDHSIQKYKWDLETCKGIRWTFDRVSEEGRPLIYAEFGETTSSNKTLILSMVHPDEITPLYLGFKLAHFFKDHESELKDSHVILAPVVNPDGHFRKPITRMNSRGVDLNRNFDTPLWREKAVKEWNTTLRKNPRRFPGNTPNSEEETKFQVDLIERYKPTKILSVHAPLNVMDYDGPSSLTLDRFAKEYVHECYQLRNQIKAKSTGFFPGSLGNYSGVERGIPTVTLELPSANPRLAKAFWKKFQPGIHSMVNFKFDNVDSTFVKNPAPTKKVIKTKKPATK